MKKTSLQWRVNTPEFLREVLEHSGAKLGICQQPFMIFKAILAEVSDRAIELNDPQLNCLMIRLALYEGTLPSDAGHEAFDNYLTRHSVSK